MFIIIIIIIRSIILHAITVNEIGRLLLGSLVTPFLYNAQMLAFFQAIGNMCEFIAVCIIIDSGILNSTASW